jgi:hypothetical protein
MNWRILAVVAALTIAFSGLFLVWFTYVDREDSVLCAGLYDRAHSAEDTSRVDAVLPPREQPRRNVRTCGELRRAGVGPLAPKPEP